MCCEPFSVEDFYTGDSHYGAAEYSGREDGIIGRCLEPAQLPTGIPAAKECFLGTRFRIIGRMTHEDDNTDLSLDGAFHVSQRTTGLGRQERP